MSNALEVTLNNPSLLKTRLMVYQENHICTSDSVQ
jgi:hypothetical protein